MSVLRASESLPRRIACHECFRGEFPHRSPRQRMRPGGRFCLRLPVRHRGFYLCWCARRSTPKAQESDQNAHDGKGGRGDDHPAPGATDHGSILLRRLRHGFRSWALGRASWPAPAAILDFSGPLAAGTQVVGQGRGQIAHGGVPGSGAGGHRLQADGFQSGVEIGPKRRRSGRDCREPPGRVRRTGAGRSSSSYMITPRA